MHYDFLCRKQITYQGDDAKYKGHYTANISYSGSAQKLNHQGGRSWALVHPVETKISAC